MCATFILLEYMKKIVLVIAIVSVVFLGGVLFWRSKKTGGPELTTATVKRTRLVQSVEETGSVAASVEVAYGVESSGRVVAIHKKIGDQVHQGDVIVQLDNTTERYRVAQTQAVLARAEATLNAQLAGPTPEARRESQAAVTRAEAVLEQTRVEEQQTNLRAQLSVEQAQKALETAENDLRLLTQGGASQLVVDAVEDLLLSLNAGMTTVGDALRTADAVLGVDNVSANDEFEIHLGARGGSELLRAQAVYKEVKQERSRVMQVLDRLQPTSAVADVRQAATRSSDVLQRTKQTLSYTSILLDQTSPGAGLTSAQLTQFKSNILTAQGTIDTALSSAVNALQALASAENAVATKRIAYEKVKMDLGTITRQANQDRQAAIASVRVQEAALEQARAAHAKLIARPREVDIANVRADVSRERAVLNSAIEDLNRRSLRAVTDGIVAKLDVKKGQTVTAQEKIITLISADRKVEVDVSEADIAKVVVGDIALLTLDAFGDEVEFSGRVVSIEPAETEISGVIYYRTEVVFDAKEGYDVKSGMTANVRIITDERDDVLVVAQRAILVAEDGIKKIRVLRDAATGSFDERVVTTGLRGDEGLVEVISGLSEGETVVTFVAQTEQNKK